ncbi:MAG: extracellular solute-binding protein [Armatimonadetes bacterium]|nr:extracellular solute-binding protein [Armatimonadota bacterium]
MKTIIKILFFISLVFIAGLFSCAKNKTSLPPNQVNIDFMWWGAESETLTIKELLNKFSQLHPQIKVNFMYVEWNNFWDKLDTKIAAGKPPDVSRLVWQKIGRYNKQKVFLNLKPYLPQKFKKNFLPLLWEAVEQNEEVIGIPYVTGAGVNLKKSADWLKKKIKLNTL